MGSDMHHYSQMVMEHSHGGLIKTLREVKVALLADNPDKWEDLLNKIQIALNNASIS
jgi:hypothetical protein